MRRHKGPQSQSQNQFQNGLSSQSQNENQINGAPPQANEAARQMTGAAPNSQKQSTQQSAQRDPRPGQEQIGQSTSTACGQLSQKTSSQFQAGCQESPQFQDDLEEVSPLSRGDSGMVLSQHGFQNVPHGVPLVGNSHRNPNSQGNSMEGRGGNASARSHSRRKRFKRMGMAGMAERPSPESPDELTQPSEADFYSVSDDGSGSIRGRRTDSDEDAGLGLGDEGLISFLSRHFFFLIFRKSLFFQFFPISTFNHVQYQKKKNR